MNVAIKKKDDCDNGGDMKTEGFGLAVTSFLVIYYRVSGHVLRYVRLTNHVLYCCRVTSHYGAVTASLIM